MKLPFLDLLCLLLLKSHFQSQESLFPGLKNLCILIAALLGWHSGWGGGREWDCHFALLHEWSSTYGRKRKVWFCPLPHPHYSCPTSEPVCTLKFLALVNKLSWDKKLLGWGSSLTLVPKDCRIQPTDMQRDMNKGHSTKLVKEGTYFCEVKLAALQQGQGIQKPAQLWALIFQRTAAMRSDPWILWNKDTYSLYVYIMLQHIFFVLNAKQKKWCQIYKPPIHI